MKRATPGYAGEEVIRPLEAHARKQQSHRDKPDQAEKGYRAVRQSRFRQPYHINGGSAIPQGSKIDRETRDVEPPGMRGQGGSSPPKPRWKL